MSLDTAKLGGPYACVFDVGAFQGDFARACHRAWPAAHVECFEPLLPNPDRTPAASDEAFVGWVSWHQIALGEVHRDALIYRCEFVPSSSMLRMNDLHKDAFPYTRRNSGEWIVMQPLSDFGDLIERPALLKIDVQGYELEVLRGAGPDLERFDAVALEVSHEPLYEGAPTFYLLDAFLIGAGFWWSRRLDELRHPKTGALLQSDELWLR